MTAHIPQNDIRTIWSDVWLRKASNWQDLQPEERLKLIHEDHHIYDAGEQISKVRRDFSGILSKADPNIRRFVNEVAVPVTVMNSVYKGVPSSFSRATNAVTSFLIDVAETFNREVIPGYAAWADGGTAGEIATSASSDLVLTYIGGKAIKLAWKGTTALGKGLSALTKKQTANITWGMWSDLPKATYKGREYAKIGDYFYSKHAVEHMSFGALGAKLPSSIPGKSTEMRRVSSMIVEEAMRYGSKERILRDGGW